MENQRLLLENLLATYVGHGSRWAGGDTRSVKNLTKKKLIEKHVYNKNRLLYKKLWKNKKTEPIWKKIENLAKTQTKHDEIAKIKQKRNQLKQFTFFTFYSKK